VPRRPVFAAIATLLAAALDVFHVAERDAGSRPGKCSHERVRAGLLPKVRISTLELCQLLYARARHRARGHFLAGPQPGAPASAAPADHLPACDLSPPAAGDTFLPLT
jgi:hypothetical protein